MPPVVAAIAVKLAAITLTSVIIGTLKFVGLFVAGKLITKATESSFDTRATSHTVNILQAVTAQRILYGERRISGPITFIGTTGDNNRLEIVITLCAHQVDAIDTVFFNDIPIYNGFINGSGEVTAGQYGPDNDNNPIVRIFKSLGNPADNSQPFPELVARDAGWTEDHRQVGHAKIYVSLRFQKDAFKGGVPNISAHVRGKKVLDNRTAATHWNPNPCVCIEDYLRTTVLNSGLSVPAAQIDTTTLDASANVSDEFVETKAIEHVVDNEHPVWGGVKISTDQLRFSGDQEEERTFLEFFTGDKVRLFDVSGSLPTGLAVDTDYYVIVMRQMRTRAYRQDANNQAFAGGFPVPGGGPWFWPTQIRLATSYTNALKGTQIDLTGSSTGTFTVRKLAEPRYTCNYMIDVNRQPFDILKEMASSMNPLSGGVKRIAGSWFFNAARWVAPTVTLDEDATISPINMRTNVSRLERVNTVTGLYASHINFDQPVSYPEVTNALYVTEDGEKIPAQVDLAATTRPATAQRMAKIVLEDARQAITVGATFSQVAMQIIAGDNFTYNIDRFGWSGKPFRTTKFGLSKQDVAIGDGEAHPVDVISLEFKETAEGIYDWNSGEETLVDLASNTDLPSAFLEVTPPTSLQIVETIQVPTGIKAIGVVTLSWTASTHAFVASYHPEYRLAASATWVVVPSTEGVTIDINDLDPALYVFRVRARTTLGAFSIYVQTLHGVTGLSAKPENPTGLQAIISEGSVLLKWIQSIAADVRWGGQVEVRHDSDISTPDWANSVSIGSPGGVHGNAVEGTVPLRDGHYLIKFVDSSGNKSVTEASVRALQYSAHNWTTLDTQTEEAGFAGAKTQVVVDGATLTLDVDGSGNVFTTGLYEFTSGVDLGAVRNVRVTPLIDVVSSLVNDLIDSRSGNVDDWLDWDGIEGSECDVRMEFRTAPDNVPTWGAWELLDANIVNARHLEYRAQFTSTDDEANIAVSTLQVKVEERLAL